MERIKKVMLISLITLCFGLLKATSFYVSTTASSSGNGSITNPWQLQTALNHPALLLPGDTVWIRGGVYTYTYDPSYSFMCKTNGTAANPIIFRNYKKERVTIDGNQNMTIGCDVLNCSNTWFWGLEVTNSLNTHRKQSRNGGIYCTAKGMKFINLIIHDTGEGIDCWSGATNAEIHGCVIYNIGNNVLNNTNWEGHGHGFYMQNDTISTRLIHNNIIHNTFGYGMKIWQTNTIVPIGNFDVQRNTIFNCGSASENLGGIGNNYRTHNLFAVSNGSNNPIRNTTIKSNYTFASPNQPRLPVNAVGLNFGVKNMILDSNIFTCQTRLGFNNTPVFQCSVKNNKFIGGILPAYGYYLWGFTNNDYLQNTYVPNTPTGGLEYYFAANKFEAGKSNLTIYNWDSLANVSVNVCSSGLMPGDKYKLTNVSNYFSDTLTGTVPSNCQITIPMIGRTVCSVIGSTQTPVNPFPKFGVFSLQKTGHTSIGTGIFENSDSFMVAVFPNPFHEICRFKISNLQSKKYKVVIINTLGQIIEEKLFVNGETEIDNYGKPKGIYNYVIYDDEKINVSSGRIIVN